MTVTSAELPAILASHRLWLRAEGGSRADLSGADLSGVNLSGVNLSGVNLPGADLSGADLSGVNLSGVNLSGANLSGANLSGANLSRADLSGADLSGADLSGAYLSGAYLSRVNLSGADLSGADLSGAKDVIDGGQRLDGYRFIGWIKAGALMVRAGCRNLTIAQAREHWFLSRGGTPLGDETTAILDHIERVAVARGLLSAPDSPKEHES